MSTRTRFRRLGGIVAALALAYLLIWPVEIDPVAWHPPAAPGLVGAYAVNDRLRSLERLGEGLGIGPEDVAIDGSGRLYGGMLDGTILRFDPGSPKAEVLADTGGRPLGLDFDPAGNLIVADGYRGLLRVAPDGSIEVLATEADGVPFRFTDDVDVAPDGTIYFSDASHRFGPNEVMADIFEHRGNGRLLAYDPETRATRVLLDGLQFANGVAVAPDGSSVLVVETGTYRIHRVWLDGPRAGAAEVFIDNLPGFPDGVSSNGRDTYWVAIFSPRDAAADLLAPWPFARKVVWRLPELVRPEPKRYSMVLGLDLEGRVVHNLQDPGAVYAPITSVEEHAGQLYFGSLTEPALGRLPAPAPRGGED